MFSRRCWGRTKKQSPHGNVVLDERKRRSVARTSVAPPAPPAAAERTQWRSRLFGRPETKESSPSDVRTAAARDAAPKTSWWRQLFKCCRRSARVAPADDSTDERRSSPDPRRRRSEVDGTPEPPEQDDHGRSSSFSHQDPVTPFTESLESLDDLMMAEFMDFSSLRRALLEEQLHSTKLDEIFDGLGTRPVDCYGFPNFGQSCYVNSSLQSLLTLEDFIGDISRAEEVWTSTPEAQLMRRLMEIRDLHTSTHPQTKTSRLRAFKDAVSARAPEFRDPLQKDAHEFLTSVLDQMRSLNPLLQEAAARTGRCYTCPVEDHMMFRMENTRTCRSCGAQSTRQEEFTNLCLDLLPGGSVEELLQEYLKETELEFSCECGGKTSSRSSSFVTLPRVLILQLKRFRLSPSFELQKADDPVTLQRDLVVSSRQGGGCFSLVSAISHFGDTEAGHYICDGVHPSDSLDEPTDRWLCYDDSMVSETTGSTVCDQRQEEAYILFYKRQVLDLTEGAGTIALQELQGEEPQPQGEEGQPQGEEPQPQVEERQPQVEERQPQVEERQPQVEELQPQVEERQPQVEELQPQVEERQPQVEERQPQGEERQPQGEERQPQGEERQPQGVERQPQVEERQPQVEERQPQGEERQPQVEERQPQVEERQPQVEERQPQSEEHQPQGEERQPQGEERQPQCEEREPQGEELQLQGEGLQPQGEERQPQREERQPQGEEG